MQGGKLCFEKLASTGTSDIRSDIFSDSSNDLFMHDMIGPWVIDSNPSFDGQSGAHACHGAMVNDLTRLPGVQEQLQHLSNTQLYSIFVALKLKGSNVGKTVWLLAPIGVLRNDGPLEEGEELSFDYGEEYWSNHKFTTSKAKRKHMVNLTTKMTMIMGDVSEYNAALKKVNLSRYPQVRSIPHPKVRQKMLNKKRAALLLKPQKMTKKTKPKKKKGGIKRKVGEDDEENIVGTYTSTRAKFERFNKANVFYPGIVHM